MTCVCVCVCVCVYRSCSEGSSYGEMLLLITIHLREKQLPQLEALIASTLGMKITVSQMPNTLLIIIIMILCITYTV